MSKQLENLIDKFGAEGLKIMIDQKVVEKADSHRLATILHSHESAEQWFVDFCKGHGLTVNNVYDQRVEQQDPEYNKYGKSCLKIADWNSQGPYVYLWLNKNCKPHFELGNSIYDMWSYHGYQDLVDKINQIIAKKTG